MRLSMRSPIRMNVKDTKIRCVPSERCGLVCAYLNSSSYIYYEVQWKVGLAAASFAKLSARVFNCRYLSVPTKLKVYNAVCTSILLYCSEAWVPYRRHIKELEKFHTRCLQRILGLKWWNCVPHLEIRRCAGIDPIETIMAQRRLQWVGHIIMMPESRLQCKIMYG